MKTVKASNVDEYIAGFSKDVQQILRQVRQTITKAAPQANESISYGIPAYKVNGKHLVYFAGYEKHVGLYATPAGHEAFAKELSKYKQGKGSVQFPLDKPMPLDLITRIVKFKVKQNTETGSFFSSLSAPARRALESNGIKKLQQLTKYSESEILKFHGVGKTTIPILRKVLSEKGLDFKNSSKNSSAK